MRTRPRIRTETFTGSKPVPSTSWGSRAWWTWRDSNSRHTACKAVPSPFGLRPMRTASWSRESNSVVRPYERQLSPHCTTSSWGDRGDSNSLVTRFTTWRIDHFCFGHSPPPGNRTPSRLCVGQLLAIELEAVVRGSNRTRTRSDQIKSLVPVQSGAAPLRPARTIRTSDHLLIRELLHQTELPQGGGSTWIRTRSASASRSCASTYTFDPWSCMADPDVETRTRVERALTVLQTAA